MLFLTTAIVQSLVDWTIKANAHLTKQIYASPSPFVCLKKAVKLLMNTFLKQNHIASILQYTDYCIFIEMISRNYTTLAIRTICETVVA